MAEQHGDKRHPATERRRQQAREKGQVPRSTDLASALLLMVAIATLWGMGRKATGRLGVLITDALSGAAPAEINSAEVTHLLGRAAMQTGLITVPILVVMFVSAVLVHLLQTGPMLAPDRVMPKLSNISPLKGVGRLFSLSNLMRLTFGVFKLSVVATVAIVAVLRWRAGLLEAAMMSPEQVGRLLVDCTLGTCLWIGGALLVLALFDYAFQWWKHEQDLRMTDQELRDEMKETDGNPQVAARRREVRRQLAMQRLSADVPKADVVVTNPTELAIAIQYDPTTMPAPLVVAKGAGLVAQRIRRIALERGVPIVERKPLAQALYHHVEVGQAVPVDQYQAVAEVLRYVYQLQGKKIPTAA